MIEYRVRATYEEGYFPEGEITMEMFRDYEAAKFRLQQRRTELDARRFHDDAWDPAAFKAAREKPGFRPHPIEYVLEKRTVSDWEAEL